MKSISIWLPARLSVPLRMPAYSTWRKQVSSMMPVGGSSGFGSPKITSATGLEA